MKDFEEENSTVDTRNVLCSALWSRLSSCFTPALFCGLLLSDGLPAYGGEGPAFSPSAEGGRFERSLEAGWNLVSFPIVADEDLLPILENKGLSVWELHAGGPSRPKTVRVASTRLEPESGYWVWAPEPTHMGLQGELVLGPVASSTETDAGWRFISVTERMVYQDPNLTRVVRWNNSKQSFERLRVGAFFVPGHGYWAKTQTHGEPLQESCLPHAWDFADAVAVVRGCPVVDDGSRIVARSDWSVRRTPAPVVVDARAHPRTIVLARTMTSSRTSVGAFEAREMVERQKVDLDAHFVVAPGPRGDWEIYEGRRMAPGAHGRALPNEIRIALMGTYEPIDAAHYEETLHGFDPDAPPSRQQPPRDAVLRLSELVAYLSGFSGIENLVAESPLRPGVALTHLVDALNERFLGFRRGDAADPEVQPEHPEGLPGVTPPTLLVLEPSEDVVHAQNDWLTVGGEVFGEDLRGFYINGLLVSAQSRSFHEVVQLAPGENRIVFTVLSRSGLRQKVEKTVVRDVAPPKIHVSVAEPQGPLDHTLEVSVQITEPSLAEVWFNGEAVETRHAFVRRINAFLLPLGLSTFEVVARDLAGRQGSRSFSVFRNEQEILALGDPLGGLTASDEPDPPVVSAVESRAPALTVSEPAEDVFYTRSEDVRIAGTAIDDNFWSVSINGLLVSVDSGSFARTMHLEGASTKVEIVAKDAADNQSVAEVEFVFDATPPEIILSHAEYVTTYEPRYVLRGAVSEPHLAKLTLQTSAEEEHELAVVNGFFSSEVLLEEGDNAFVVTALDRAGNQHSKKVAVRFQPEWVAPKRTGPPEELSGTASGKTVRLWWAAPALFEDGRSIPNGLVPVYTVYRDGQEVARTTHKHHQEEAPELGRRYRYQVSATIPPKSGEGLESIPSAPITLDVSSPPPATPPGDFEPPHVLTEDPWTEEMPKTALSTTDGKTVAHVAFVARGQESEGDRLLYTQSTEAGRAGSFPSPKAVASASPRVQITDIALAAQGQNVSVSWIQGLRDEGSSSQIFVAQSEDGGQSFGAPRSLRETSDWKRGLDMAYDRSGQHHLVWGEANKVYYLKDLAGIPSNVFDARVREPATEIIRYQAQYEPVDGGCGCPNCWCDEFYVQRDEPDPQKGGEPVGPYVYRIEETYTYEPSLHVDDETVSIVARQARMWDNKSVPNPHWEAMMQSPVYSDDIVERLRPTRLVVGWRSTWKKAYEAGDEGRYAALGYTHQFHYDGTWHRQQVIQVAQRPLQEDAWAEHARAPWKRGMWLNDREANWRIAVVDDGFPSEGVPSHPKLSSAPGGVLVAVYEKGPSSNPNEPGQNPLYAAHSANGGRTWSPPVAVGKGYLPAVATAATGELNMVFYAAKAQEADSEIRVVRKLEAQDYSVAQKINRGSPAPVHWKSHGEDRGSLPGAPSLSAHEELFFAAWVRRARDGQSTDRIVTTRASDVTTFSHLDVALADQWTRGQSASVTVTAQNKFHMRLATQEQVELSSPSQDRQNTGSSQVSPARGAASGGSSGFQATGGRASRTAPTLSASPSSGVEPEPTSFALHLHEGVGQVVMTAGASGVSGALGETSVSDLYFTAALAEAEPGGGFGARVSLVPGHVGGNYEKAVTLRDGLLRRTTDEATGQEFYYQVEYRPDESKEEAVRQMDDLLDPGFFDQPQYRDSRHLAGFRRVWAYTQGIALAQFARMPARYGREARGLARYICHHAVRQENSDVILGWPFSWNTDGDDWRDARLVTGANAWVIQGLGVFVASPAYENADPEDRVRLKACYHQALIGLEDHRHRLVVSESRMGSIMTAGYSTQGLENVSTPHLLASSGAFGALDGSHRFLYYSVLDAIGYAAFAPTHVRVCHEAPDEDCYALSTADPAWQDYEIDEAEWTLLRRRVLASNVVTEHNLDVLSVLNHALVHADAVGPDGIDERRRWRQKLQIWRDELRDGTFELLWDAEGWKQEFAEVLAELETRPASQALTDAQAKAQEKRMEAMESALQSGGLGRVITGGLLFQEGEGQGRFEASRHTAIDNCSWLSLSVNYDDLEDGLADGYSLYTERLALCLEYTILQYAKDLSYGEDGCSPDTASCPPKRTYRGTHYFQNSFRDTYIEPSELQESSYHLEATMGLILGLYRFAHARPDHPASEAFLAEAQSLWAGAQAFVRDHGFVYSSQRIQDLSAILVSSTALVWFIDVYDYLDAEDRGHDEPLKPYDRVGEATRHALRGLDEALQTYRASGGELVESGLTRSEKAPYTLLVDQALALLVASHTGDEEGAASLALGLLSMRGDAFWPAVYRESLEPIFPERQSLEGQMVALYALARFMDQNPDTDLEDEVASVLASDLNVLLDRHVVLDESPLSGLFRRPEDPTTASLEDNLMAYFALDLVGRRLADTAAGPSFAQSKVDLGHRLAELCGLEDGAIPARWVGEWGMDRSALDGFKALKPCALFAFHIGAIEAALSLVEAGEAVLAPQEWYRSEPAEVASQSGSQETHRFSVHQIFGLLAKRGLASFDPRQDEIVRVELAHQRPGPGVLSQALAAILVDDPRGVFGVHAAPLTGAAATRGAFRFAPAHYGAVTRVLGNRFLEAVAALLAADYRATRFDTLLTEMVVLQEAYDHIFDTLAPGSRNTRFSMMRNTLKTGLCAPQTLIQQASLSVEARLGFGCETAMVMLGRLFGARGISGDRDAWISTIEGNEGGSWQTLLAKLTAGSEEEASAGVLYLGAESAWSDQEPVSYTFLREAARPELSEAASIVEVRHAIRERTKSALEFGLGHVGAKNPIVFALGDIDPIHAFNPGSPDYWKRGAIELRLVLSRAHKHEVQFVFRGAPAPQPAFPLSQTHAQNVRSLRRWFNTQMGGDLSHLAEAAGVAPEHRASWLSSVHRMLRTGVVPRADADALLSALGLSTDVWNDEIAFEANPFAMFHGVASGQRRGHALVSGGLWGEPELAFGYTQTSIGPIHDTSFDQGLIGEKRILGTAANLDVWINPVLTSRGDYAVLKGRRQCLFQLENKGSEAVRYEVLVDGERFGPVAEFADETGFFGTFGARTVDVCDTVSEKVSGEADVVVKNLTTGETFEFVFPVRFHESCYAGETVSSEQAKDMVDSGEWNLETYRTQDCGDMLVLDETDPRAGLEVAFAPSPNNGPFSIFGPSEEASDRPQVVQTSALSILGAVRLARGAKQVLRAGSGVRGAASSGLSLEEIGALAFGVLASGTVAGMSDEIGADIESLMLKSVRIFENPPKGSWAQVGWVSAWEVFAEGDEVIRALPIYNRNNDGEWAITARFNDDAFYGLVQPSVHAGPKLPILDPAVSLFAHDITSKMAVYKYTGRVEVDASAKSLESNPIDTPLEAFLNEVDAYPDWVYTFPPEFHYPIIITLFIEPQLAQNSGGAQSTKSLEWNRPGVFKMEGEDVLYNNLHFQKQPSMPIELQNPGYTWGLWPGTDWHVYGPPNEVSAFVDRFAYTSAGKKTGTAKSPKAKTPPKKTGTPTLKKATTIVRAGRLSALRLKLNAMMPLLDANGPAYEYSPELAQLITTLEGHLRTWAGLKPVAALASDARFKLMVGDFKLNIVKHIVPQIEWNALKIDSEASFAEVEQGVDRFLALTEGGALYRDSQPIVRWRQNELSKVLNESTGLVFRKKENKYVLLKVADHPRPKPQDTLHTVTYLRGTDAFSAVDLWAKTVARAHWVHSKQTSNFFVIGDAWRREYTPEGEFVDVTFFLEEELIRLGQKGEGLKKKTLPLLVARLLHINPQTKSESAYASPPLVYVGPEPKKAIETREYLMNQPTTKKFKKAKNFYSVSIMSRSIYIVFPISAHMPVFKMNRYLLEGVATDVQGYDVAQKTALGYVKKGQLLPWFVADRTKIKYFDAKGDEVLESAIVGAGKKEPSIPSPKKDTTAPATESEKNMYKNLSRLKEVFEKNQGTYGKWAEAQSAIVALEGLLPWLQKKSDARELRERDEIETVVASAVTEIDAILAHMGPAIDTTGYRLSVVPLVDVASKKLLEILEGGLLLYDGHDRGGVGNGWAQVAQKHVVVLRHKGGRTFHVYAAEDGRPDTQIVRDWALDSAQYFGKPKKDFSDVDAWAKSRVAEVWYPSFDFFVFGDGWAREYSKQGEFVQDTHPLRAYMMISNIGFSPSETEQSAFLARSLGVDSDNIRATRTEVAGKKLTARKSMPDTEQFQIAMLFGNYPLIYVQFGSSIADTVTEALAPYRFLGAGTSKTGNDAAKARAALKELIPQYVPKDQGEQWYIATPQRTDAYGGDVETIEENEKKTEAPPELTAAQKEKLDPTLVEVLERYPGWGTVKAASKTEIKPEDLLLLTSAEQPIIHLIYLPDGYWVAVPGKQPNTHKGQNVYGRFEDYTYLGLASHDFHGVGKGTATLKPMVKKIMLEGQKKGYFIVAPDVQPPYRFDVKGNPLKDKPGVFRFSLQSESPLPMEAVEKNWNSFHDHRVYAYSQEHGYVVFSDKDNEIWSEVRAHPFRVLVIFSPDSDGYYAKSSYKERLKEQPYVIIAHNDSEYYEDGLGFRVHENTGEPVGHDKLKDEDNLMFLTDDIKLNAEGSVPDSVRFETTKGPFTLDWSKGLTSGD